MCVLCSCVFIIKYLLQNIPDKYFKLYYDEQSAEINNGRGKSRLFGAMYSNLKNKADLKNLATKTWNKIRIKYKLPIDSKILSYTFHNICSVCHETFQDGDSVKELVCKHLYHPDCIGQWLKDHVDCPMCRKSV